MPTIMKGDGLEAGRLVAVGDDDGGARRKRSHVLELGEVAHLERQQSELFVDRNLLAHDGGGKHLAHGIVGINLPGVFRHLHGDIAGEAHARQDHRIAPHIGGAGLGVFDRVVAEARAGLEAFGFDAADAARVGLEGVDDLVVGVRRQVGDDDLDALIFRLESDEGFGADQPDQRDHADPGAGRKYGVGSLRRSR